MPSELVPTIGLEIHAELKTASKMFCGCKNDPHQERPNIHVCPVCMAHPGTLPVINKEAVRHVLRVGIAVGGTIATFTEFDRKNYFYPDIPKNYQISQYKFPLIHGGSIRSVALTRIHLEEDTARSAHGESSSVVDFNRAGVPLMELVTEPVIHDAATAVHFARELRLLLKYLGASDANLERGEMRIEANISVASPGGPLGTKVEVKNLNSFKAVEQAITYEIQRHKDAIADGEKIIQETRGWDENKQRTFSQRIKESSHDYRYFPEPDLPKLQLDGIASFSKEELKKTIPRLPWELREEYRARGLQDKIIEVIVGDTDIHEFYSGVCGIISDEKARVLAANYLTTDILGNMSKPEYAGRPLKMLDVREYAKLIHLVMTGVLSSRGAKDTLSLWLTTGGDPEVIANEQGLLQISDVENLAGTIRTVLKENMNAVSEYRAGKEQALQFLIGQCMKATRGAANPQTLKIMLVDEISRIS